MKNKSFLLMLVVGLICAACGGTATPTPAPVQVKTCVNPGPNTDAKAASLEVVGYWASTIAQSVYYDPQDKTIDQHFTSTVADTTYAVEADEDGDWRMWVDFEGVYIRILKIGPGGTLLHAGWVLESDAEGCYATKP